MEQKKILLVAISVGVFLVIVVGAALLIFRANNSSPAIASGRYIPPGTSGIYLDTQPLYSGQPIQPGLENRGTQPQRTETASSIAEIIVAPRNGNNESNENSALPVSRENINSESPTVISVSRPSTVAVPDVPPASTRPSSTAQTPARLATPAPAPAQTAAPVPQSAPVQAAAATRPTTPRTHINYWVQTGSFTAMARAQGAKETLASKGIASIIENRDVEGTTYFRVRVGPYTSQNEADYWLSLIKSIDGFQNSQVWQTQSIN